MSPEEAKEFGLIDEVVVSRPVPEDDENGGKAPDDGPSEASPEKSPED